MRATIVTMVLLVVVMTSRAGEAGRCQNVDEDHYCEHWKKEGHCVNSPVRMAESCAETCGYCKRPAPIKNTDCQDSDDDCGIMTQDGECERCARIRRVCAKTCGVCHTECVDRWNQTLCENWAESGECNSHMTVCRKTCNNCGGTPVDQCKDDNTYTMCDVIVVNKRCNDPGDKCRKTCKKC